MRYFLKFCVPLTLCSILVVTPALGHDLRLYRWKKILISVKKSLSKFFRLNDCGRILTCLIEKQMFKTVGAD
jgi:hypothetical protein